MVPTERCFADTIDLAFDKLMRSDKPKSRGADGGLRKEEKTPLLNAEHMRPEIARLR